MKDSQTLTITGKLGEDPKVIKTENSEFVAISVASSTPYKDTNGEKQVKTTWIDYTANGKTGEILSKYFKKGNTVLIEAEPYNTKRTVGKGKSAVIITGLAFNIKSIRNFSDNRKNA